MITPIKRLVNTHTNEYYIKENDLFHFLKNDLIYYMKEDNNLIVEYIEYLIKRMENLKVL